MHESGGMQSQLPMCWRKDDLNCGPKIASVLILEESKHQQSVETEDWMSAQPCSGWCDRMESKIVKTNDSNF